MPSVRRLFALLIGCVFPSTVAAQAWRDAYNAREYERAANLLHEIVTDLDFMFTSRDPGPTRHLAVLYANGLGVTPDPIAACSLALDAELATNMASPTEPTKENLDQYNAALEESKEFAAAHCSALSPTDLVTASNARGGFYFFGMPEQVVTVGGQAVRIGRSGIALEGKPDRSISLMSAAAIGRVRPFSIDPPEDAAPGVVSRHFIEFVVWRNDTDQRTRTRRYVASWQICEVHPNSVQLFPEETLDGVPHWPGAVVPSSLDAGLTMEMIRSGHVRWRIDGGPPKRGWLMLSTEKEPQ